jgi:replicative DNA helicase
MDINGSNAQWVKNGQLTGWVEKREDGKVAATIRAYYNVVEPSQHKSILAKPDYSQTTENHMAQKAETASFYKAIHRDIFKSSLTLLSQSTLTTSMRLEVTLQFPHLGTDLTFLAQVTKVSVETEWNKESYHADLKNLAVSQKSLQKMIDHLNKKKT